MASFTTTIYLNGKEYEAEVSGYHQKFERGTLESPEIKASFDVEKLIIKPSKELPEVDLMELRWLVEDTLLEEIEKDYFNLLKGEDYE
jgi:hypothetical protein